MIIYRFTLSAYMLLSPKTTPLGWPEWIRNEIQVVNLSRQEDFTEWIIYSPNIEMHKCGSPSAIAHLTG
jgi:hypothetical protein